ncbi:hypothetical protein Btru_031417 [Bulinus truncatus]|nr:hypothetical protein Btru_031417 [Bulinus truncatus]
MADSEKKISKLKRRFSKKPAKENGEDSGSSKFFSKKTSHAKDLTVSDELSNCGGKSATLPEGMSLHHPHSEGLFSKLKRRFHFSSKGKYDFKSFISSPTKPHWMRRKSDDTQLRHPVSLTESTSDSGAVVTKSQSVKTQRKAKSDKEEVILIRKDQRVSVLCKTENGGKPEIIFTNEDVSDEDSSGIWGRIEEDPYATISSVHEEIIHKTKTNSKENSVIGLSPSISPEPLPANGHNVPVLPDEHYPYARINPDRNRSPESQNMYPQAKLFNLRASAYIKCRKEPDYETLDEIKEQKRALNSLIEAEDSAAVVNGSEVQETEAAMPELDPDYETLDEVKERCAKLSTASPPPVDTGSDASRCSKTDVKSPTDATSLVFDSSDVQQNVGFDTRKSPILQTHAVSSPESTSTHDRFPEPSIEDCIYDNPNVIIRKHKTDAVFNSRRGQTMYEPPLIKTPAEEELVEKLSSLLAPPLPLRNYQKDETGAKRIEGNDSKMASSPTNKSPNSVVEVIDSVESVVKHGNTMTSSSSDSLDTQISQSLPENGLEHTHPVDHYKDACQLDFCVNLAMQIVKDACERAVNQVKEQLNALSHGPHKICSLGNHLNSCAGALGEHLQNSEPNQVLQIKVESKLTGKKCDFENGGKALTSTLDCILTDASNNKENLAPTSLDRIIKSETPDLHESSNGRLEPFIRNGEDSGPIASNGRLEPVIRNGEDSGPIASNEEKSEDKTELYKLQGARPKFKPLILPSQTIYLKDQRFCPSVTKDTFVSNAGQGERRNLKEQLSDDSHTWDEAMSPSFSDLNFHEAITESLQLEPKNVPASAVKSSVLISESDQGAANSDNDFHAQETVYLDSDSETEEGLSVHNSLVVHVKRDLRVTRVAKPILYANPRFLENTISGPFTSGQSLDVNYLANGVFKWGRYFHDFVHDREQVEGKLKSFFHFIRHMLMSESDLNAMNPQVKDLQEKFDSMQARIEKRFHFIKDLPTFQDVRIQLLKTEELDNWVPEFSQHFNRSRKLSYTRENKEVNGRLVCAPQVPPKEDEVIRDDLHSDECMVAGADGTCPLGCIHSPCLSPTKPQDVLEDLLSLSGGMLTCASCGKEEESDSEDEMIVLETYARTVCCAPSKSSDSRVNYTKNAVYCRALYGELAYTAKIRKPRSLSKSILVPGCSEECCGGGQPRFVE